MTTSEAPRVGGFWYEVSIEISLPLPHAEMLHTTALHHYDSAVRASACAGTINALRNVAQWTRIVSGFSPAGVAHRLTMHEIDTCIKALEHPVAPGADGDRLVLETRRTLREAMAAVDARWAQLAHGVSPEVTVLIERANAFRAIKTFPRRTAVFDRRTGAWEVTQPHPDGRQTKAHVSADGHAGAIEATRFILPYFAEEDFAL